MQQWRGIHQRQETTAKVFTDSVESKQSRAEHPDQDQRPKTRAAQQAVSSNQVKMEATVSDLMASRPKPNESNGEVSSE